LHAPIGPGIHEPVPELPEAETIARQLHAGLAGAVVSSVRVQRADILHGDPRPLAAVIRRRRVEGVTRRAKRVQVQLDGGVMLVFRLGMSGRLTLVPRAAPVEPHTHVCIRFRARGDELRFRDPRRFGGVWCLSGREAYAGRRMGEVGPEPLTLEQSAFAAILKDRRRSIKSLLLDQTLIAGLGNIYCDEALFAAGIHPLTPAGALDGPSAQRLLRAIKRTLNRAIDANGSTLSDYRRPDGLDGSYQFSHKVYGRLGEPCRRCRVPIEKLTIAGRTTHLCPVCQVGRR